MLFLRVTVSKAEGNANVESFEVNQGLGLQKNQRSRRNDVTIDAGRLLDKQCWNLVDERYRLSDFGKIAVCRAFF